MCKANGGGIGITGELHPLFFLVKNLLRPGWAVGIEVPVFGPCLLNPNEGSWLDCWLKVVEENARSIVDQEHCAKLMKVQRLSFK